MRAIILSILFILLQSVNPFIKPKPLFKYQQLHPVDMSKYALLPADQQLVNSLFGKSYHFILLTDTDLIEVDNILIKAAKDHNSKKEYGLIYNPDNYYKQVLAAENKKGEKEVYLNCLCSLRNRSDLKKYLITVMDGGNCYFQVRINLITKRVIYFSVNGVA